MRAPRTVHTLLAAGLLLSAAPGFGAQPPAKTKPKETPPAAAPVKDVRFPTFDQKTLANGLRVVVVEQHKEPAVSLRLLFKGGKVYEPEGKAGLAAATAALLTKGTASRSAQQIAEAIDFVGGSLNAVGVIESLYGDVSVTSDQLDLGFDLLSDVVLHPSFPQEELERWRRQALSSLQIQRQNAGYLAETSTLRLVFGGHPYGRPKEGTAESLAGLTRDDLVAFHQGHFIPNEAILAVVGDVSSADAFARAERAFGSWKQGAAITLAPVEAAQTRKVLVIDKPDAVQTEIRFAQVGIPYRDPALFTSQVYNSVLGSNGSSRLFTEVRSKRGLSYGANSFFLQMSQSGLFEASTYTKTETTVQALEVALDVIRGMAKEPVPAPELNASKTFITGAFPLDIETADGVAAKVVEALRYGYGREFLESYNSKISAVSAPDVQRFAEEKIHPDQMVIVLVGKAADFSDELRKKLGDFETIPAADLDFLQADLRRPKTDATAAPASAADQAGAMERLRKAQEALGGKAYVEQRSQVSKGAGSMTPPSVPQPLPIPSIVTYRVFPDKERSEIQLPMGTMVQAFDGTTGWGSMGPQPQDTTAQSKEQKLYGFDVLRRVGQPGYTARPLPDADVAGKPVKVVEVADGAGHATRFFLDPQTSLVAKVAFASGGQTTEAFYADYRDAGGVKVPYQTNVSQNGQPLVEIKLTEVQVNAPVDEALFKKPAG